MKRWIRNLAAAALLVATASSAAAEITIRNGDYYFNGELNEVVVGRTSFKLANVVSYHYAGKGGGFYTLGSARRWVDWNRELGFEILRVLLETAGWQPCEEGLDVDGVPLNNNGEPDECMFGSEPIDQGVWHVPTLQGPARVPSMHGIGRNVLEWFFRTSEETGMAFEVVVIATAKHNGIRVGQQTHMIRQTLAQGARFQRLYPRANIVFNLINEFDAHARPERWTIEEVNALAMRANRCKHPDGRVRQSLTFEWLCTEPRDDGSCPADAWEMDCGGGFLAEQWPGHPIHVDEGGENLFNYDVGPGPREFKGGWVHPRRGRGWQEWPTPEQLRELRERANGQPVGASESMYFIEPQSLERVRPWYRPAGWTANCGEYIRFAEHAIESGIEYFIVHDQKGTQSVTEWPVRESCVETWARSYLGGDGPVEPPPVCTELPECRATGGSWNSSSCSCTCGAGELFVEDRGCVPEPTPGPSWFKVDTDNRNTLRLQANVDANDVPFVLNGGSEERCTTPGQEEPCVITAEWSSDAYRGRVIYRLATFIGLDSLDLGEFNVFVYDDGRQIVERDIHRPIGTDYPAWIPHTDARGHVVRGRLTVAIVGRATGKMRDPLHPRRGTISVRPHYGLAIVWGQ